MTSGLVRAISLESHSPHTMSQGSPMETDPPETNEPSETSSPSPDPMAERTKTIVRRIGYVTLIPLGLAIFIPMLVSVGQGIGDRRVWDPYTRELAVETAPGDECLDDATRLLERSRTMVRLHPTWDRAYRTWIVQCRDDHGDLYEVLDRVRTELRKKKRLEAGAEKS
jgi:hypothetical protein